MSDELLPFGARVIFTHALRRHVHYNTSITVQGWSGPVKRDGDVKTWHPEPMLGCTRIPETGRTGIVIGVRTLANGLREYLGYEEGIAFVPAEHLRAYVIAWDMGRKPALVLPEHVKAEAARVDTRPDLPIGTPVHAYPGTRDAEPFATVTRSEVWQLGDGTPVVAVDGLAGGIALTHIDVRVSEVSR